MERGKTLILTIRIKHFNNPYSQIRSEFDEILFRHAEQSGANTFEEYKVTSLQFAPNSEHRPVGATFTGPNGKAGSISFDYLVDASGRNGIMSTKYLQNRQMNNSLKNIACWGYWTGHGVYKPGTSRENAPYFECLTGTLPVRTFSKYTNGTTLDESGWAWFIPLHNGTVSVGMVMDSVSSVKKKQAMSKAVTGKDHSLKDHYLSQLDLVPGLKALLGGAVLQEDPSLGPSVKSATDYSYAASCYAGDHYRLVGDASAFIDPFFR